MPRNDLKEENYSLFKEAFENKYRNPSGPATSGNRY
jgi:hypothetical protein